MYSHKNVWDAALDRIRWMFDEFPNIIIGFSGGKDSVVTYQLALIVAREKGRLPLKVMFLDQEAEWQATVDIVRTVMANPEVEPLWLQVPMRLFNATSTTDHWLHCWRAEDEARWMRPREPNALTENRYGTDRFHKMFSAILATDFANEKTAYLAGVRTEESPGRFIGLTSSPTYKWATWGSCLRKKPPLHVTMYPLYDWSYLDIWKAILDNHWPYNRIYDLMFQRGVSVKDMRVSNVHHETAVTALFSLQELEPATYERLTQRIGGIDMAGKMGKDNYFVKALPHMFTSWREYRDYLLEKLITNPEWKAGLQKKFAYQEEVWGPTFGDKLSKLHIPSILTNDWEGIKLANFQRRPGVYNIREERDRLSGRGTKKKDQLLYE